MVVENAAVTVTVLPPARFRGSLAPSVTLAGLTLRFTSGAVSSSVSVTLVPVTFKPVPLPEIVRLSLPSTTSSCVGASVKLPVPVVALAAIVIEKSDTSA